MRILLYLFFAGLVSNFAIAQYHGGNVQGINSLKVNSLSLVVNNSTYSGGSNDGQSSIAGSLLLLGSSTLYSGGINDGAAVTSGPGLSLNTSSAYAGGPNDGVSLTTGTSLSLSISSRFNGGNDDRFVGVSQTGLSLGAANTVYLGVNGVTGQGGIITRGGSAGYTGFNLNKVSYRVDPAPSNPFTTNYPRTGVSGGRGVKSW